jgi:hypothetical protein
MNAKAADAAPLAAGFAFASNCSEFLHGAEILRTRANICFQCGFDFDRRNDGAQKARDQRQIEPIMGRALALVSAWPARHSARMVNGKFPDRAGHGFELVDLGESRSPVARNGHHSKFRERIRQFFSQILRELNRMQSLAIYRGTLVRLSTAKRP